MILFNLLRRKKRFSIGVDIGHSGLKVVVLRSGEGREQVEKWYLRDFPSGTIVDGRVEKDEVVIRALKDLTEKEIIPKGKLVSAVFGGRSEVKKLRLPVVGSKDLDRYVASEAEQAFALPYLSLVLDYVILREDDYGVEVLAAGVPRDKVASVRELFQRAGIDIHVLDVRPMALYHLFSYLNGDRYGGLSLVLDVGKRVTTIVLVKEGELVCAREVYLGGDTITEMVQREEGVSFEEAERLKVEKLTDGPYEEKILDKFIVSLGHDLKLVLDSCRVLLDSEAAEVERLFYTGGGASLKNFGKVFGERFDLEVKNVYHLGLRDGFVEGEVKALDRFSVALGLAIRGAVA